MRNPNSVLQEILNIIPKTETEIIKKFNHLKYNDFPYKPPEQFNECFVKLSLLCNRIIEKDNNWFNTWKLDMISILTKKSKNTLKMELNLYKNLTNGVKQE